MSSSSGVSDLAHAPLFTEDIIDFTMNSGPWEGAKKAGASSYGIRVDRQVICLEIFALYYSVDLAARTMK
jgi:hypothetical protein